MQRTTMHRSNPTTTGLRMRRCVDASTARMPVLHAMPTGARRMPPTEGRRRAPGHQSVLGPPTGNHGDGGRSCPGTRLRRGRPSSAGRSQFIRTAARRDQPQAKAHARRRTGRARRSVGDAGDRLNARTSAAPQGGGGHESLTALLDRSTRLPFHVKHWKLARSEAWQVRTSFHSCIENAEARRERPSLPAAAGSMVGFAYRDEHQSAERHRRIHLLWQPPACDVRLAEQGVPAERSSTGPYVSATHTDTRIDVRSCSAHPQG